MEPDFQCALLVVIIVGLLISAVGVTALYIAFRSFGRKSSLGIIAALLAFIFLCCGALLALSYWRS